jgi:hypothetical protein
MASELQIIEPFKLTGHYLNNNKEKYIPPGYWRLEEEEGGTPWKVI